MAVMFTSLLVVFSVENGSCALPTAVAVINRTGDGAVSGMGGASWEVMRRVGLKWPELL